MSWKRFFQRRAGREESAVELEAYLQSETEDNMKRGMSADEARRAARIKLGNVPNILGQIAEQDSIRLLETLGRDVRFGLRMLTKHRGFALVSLLTLALGIGANTAIFTVVDATLIRPLPFPNANRVVMVWERRMPDGERQNVTSPATFLDWQRENAVFDQMAAMFNDSSILSGEMPEQIATASVTPNFFSILGVNAAVGRVLVLDQDGKPDSNRAAVLGFDLWQRHFGSNPNILGTTITLDDKPYTVVGVMPRGFQFFVKQGSFSQKKPEIWLAMKLSAASASHGRYLQAIGLLRRGVPLGQAQNAMLNLTSQLVAQDPASMKNWSVNLVPLRAQLTGDVAQGLRLLLAAVGLVLLIACANVATLNLARASARRHEIAIRMALGASGRRVIRQVLTESCLLALIGGLAGFLLGYTCLSVLKSIAPANLIPLEALRLDFRVFAFAATISLVAGLLFGTIPAIDVARNAPREPLQEGAATARGRERRGMARRVLVVGEVAIALVLLMGASLLLRSFHRLLAVDPGFRSQNVLTAWIQFPNARYQKDEQKSQFFAQMLDAVRALPGVRSASADGFLPFAGIIAGTGAQVEGHPVLPLSQLPGVNVSLVEPGYFETLGIPLISGRSFNPSEAFEATGNVVISQSMAQTLWPNENPIGKRVTIYMKRENKPSTVIGVVGDVKHAGLASAVHPTAYWSYPELGFQFMTLVIRTDGDPRALIPALRQTVLRIDKNQPIADVVPMETLLSMSVARTRFSTQVMAAFAFIALLLAIVGIYGIISYDVEQRSREIGIRMALGAQRGSVIRLVLNRGMTLAGAGIAFGTVASLALTRLLTSVLYETRPTDPAVFALVCAALAALALCVAYFAVRRISSIEPMAVLRRE
jgi:putative ABC transport system permease protein